MSVQSATAGNAIHPSAQNTTTTTTAIVGPNGAVSSTITFPNGISGQGGTTTGPLHGTLIGGGGAGGGAGGMLHRGAGGSGQVITSGYAQMEPLVTHKDIQNLLNYFTSLMDGMVLLSNETEDTKQVLTMVEGFSMFAKYQALGHKVTVTKLSGEAAKVLYGAK